MLEGGVSRAFLANSQEMKSSHLNCPKRIAFLTAACIAGLAHPCTSQGYLFQKTEPPPTDQASIVMAQAYLDQILLGPGKIDGRLGSFTEQAALLYNQRYGLAPGNWWRLLREAQKAIRMPYTRYTIRQEDLKYIGPLPDEPALQQGLPYMVYRSAAEFVAERYHTTEAFLAQLNPEQSLASLGAGSTLQVPNVTPFRIEEVPELRAFEPVDAFKDRLAYVDTAAKCVKIFDKGRLLACFPVTPGEPKYIPYGDWSVVMMVTTPEFRWDKQMLEEGKRSEAFYQLPPGPNSPVGILWAGLSKSGIGLHGTANPGTIGRSQSAGCIRLANWDAIRLPSLIRPGTKVLVR